jgi:hypothetical protein
MILFFDDKLSNVMDMNTLSICKSILIDADVKHPYITDEPKKPYIEYTNNDAFFDTGMNEYTNPYAKYVSHHRGELEMPTKSITGDGRIFFLTKEGVQNEEGYQNNMDIIDSFINDKITPNHFKVVIFDWDRTITSVEGWWPEFFYDVSPANDSSFALYDSAVKNTAQYLFGGPEREEELRNMFSNLHEKDISIVILTNNPAASDILFKEETKVNTREVFLDIIKVVYPEFVEEHLISTYQGKNKKILSKSIAYKKFLESNKKHIMRYIGGKRKRYGIIQTKKRAKRSHRKRRKSTINNNIKTHRRKMR